MEVKYRTARRKGKCDIDDLCIGGMGTLDEISLEGMALPRASSILVTECNRKFSGVRHICWAVADKMKSIVLEKL